MDKITSFNEFLALKNKGITLFENKIFDEDLIIENLSITNSIFVNCVFKRITFDKCSLNNICFLKCNFNETFFNDVVFNKVRFNISSFIDASFMGLDLQTVLFSRCNLYKANLSLCDLSIEYNPDLSLYNNIDDCNFVSANLEDAKIKGAKIVNCDFTNTKLKSCDFSNSTFVFYDLEAEKRFKETDDYFPVKNGSIKAVDQKSYTFIKKSSAIVKNITILVKNPY